MEQETMPPLQERVAQLERRLRAFQVIAVLGMAAVTAAAGTALRVRSAKADDAIRILRLRGLVIEDEQGRPRILLGAPVPKVAGRRRQDDATGLIVLGENGADRVAVAAPAPDPQVMGKVSKRTSPSAGIVINSLEGNERGGLGFLDNGSVVLGLDYSDREAISLAVVPDAGYAGLMINAESGSRTERAGLAVLKDGTSLMKLSDTTGTERTILRVRNESAPRFLVIDPKRKSTVDVLEKIGP